MASRSQTGAMPAHLPRSRRARTLLGTTAQVLRETLKSCVRYRVMGLAAEAAFFALLSLPPLMFALAGSIGYIAQRQDAETIANLREEVLKLASRTLTPEAVTQVIGPTLDDVLARGRFSVISIGFLIALWSGSRALNVFVDTITIMYGLGGRRGIVRTRLLSFGLYLVFLVAGVILLPLVLAGPTLVERLLPRQIEQLVVLYWPIVLVVSTLFLATLYHLSTPVRTRWRADLPGAGVTLALWVGGSALLRVALGASTQTTSIYGPLAAPIAVLIWLYVISLAVLVGAASNAALAAVGRGVSLVGHASH